MQRLHTLPVQVAFVVVLLMVVNTANPYLGIQWARADTGYDSAIEVDLKLSQYDLLSENVKAELDDSYARLTNSIDTIADIQVGSRFRVPDAEKMDIEQNEPQEVQPTPTPTHFTQIASTSLDSSAVLGSEKLLTPTPSETPAIIQMASAPADIQALINVYAPQYGADPAKMAVIAKCESGYRTDAVSPSGKYVGLYQFVDTTWISNRNAMGLDPDPRLRAHAEEAIKTAAFKMGRDGYGAWPVCGKI